MSHPVNDNDPLFTEAALTIKGLQEQNTKWQHRYNEMRYLYYSANTQFQDMLDGSWTVTSFGIPRHFPNVEDGIAWAEKSFDERYPYPK
jgi:hypothetical protein